MKGVDVIGQLLEPATQVADGGEAKTKDGKQFEALLAEAVEQGTQGGKDALPKGKGAGQTTLVGKELPAGKETLTGKEPLATKDPLTSQELLAGKELLAAQAPVVGQERVAGQERFAGQVSVGAQLGESKELPFAKPPQNAADSPRPTRAVGPGPSLDKSRVLELPAAPRSIHSAIQAQASEPGAPPAQDELEANAKLKDAAPAEHVREPQTPEQMQAVLVQVATVVARIVAPPKDTKASVKEGVAASQGNGALSKEAELPSTTPANDVAPPVYPHEFADALSAFELVPHAEHDLSNAVTVRPSADTELTAPEAPSSGDAQGLLGRAAQRLADRGPMRAAADKVMSAFRALSGRGDAPSATTDLPLPPLASTPATAGLTNVAPVNAPEVAPPPSMPAQGVQVSAPGLPPSAPQLPASAPQLPASAPALPASAPQLLASAPALPASAPQLPASASNPLPNARVEPKGVSASAPLTVEVATQSDPTAKPIAQPLAPASPAQTDRTQTPLDVANGTTPGAADTRGPGP
ncbi:MAG TPA: hypothetical protein VI299_24475, partial [Polyangiales bacterium]